MEELLLILSVLGAIIILMAVLNRMLAQVHKSMTHVYGILGMAEKIQKLLNRLYQSSKRKKDGSHRPK